ELQQLEDRPGTSHQGFLIGGPKFWWQGSSPQDRAADSTPIGVTAGQEVKGIDIVVNGQDLGEPRPTAAQQPNPSSGLQHVTLPAVVTGTVEAGEAGVSLLAGGKGGVGAL